MFGGKIGCEAVRELEHREQPNTAVMPLTVATRIPSSTYRVQLHGKFTFDDLRGRLPYLCELGITDLYLSPIFTSTPGSEHGYDVSDYRELNPELGGQEGFDRLAVAAKEAGLGILLDFVPNHMGTQGPLNAWWRDVLELGRSSPYAPFFDIQWKVTSDGGRQRVITPVLEDHYGRVLERGKISVQFEEDFVLRIGGMTMPVSPLSYRLILGEVLGSNVGGVPSPRRDVAGEIALMRGGGTPPTGEEGEFSEWVDLLAKIEAWPVVEARHDMTTARSRAAEIAAWKKQWAELVRENPGLKRQLEERLGVINGEVGRPESFDALHEIIDRQHYRLARWKAGAHEINYRRFFAIDSLVGLRMENPEVFAESHALLQRLVREGKVTGVRIDHIDGLRLPEDYLHRLQTLNDPDQPRPLYTLVEKILAPGEELPATWPVHGTTGYEFIAQLAQLLVDGSADGALSAAYRNFTGDDSAYADAVYRNKRMIVAELFADVVSNLGGSLAELVNADRHWQDLTRYELTIALGEFLATFSTYRTYRRGEGALAAEQRKVIEEAYEKTLERNPRVDPEAFIFVRDLLTGDYPAAGAPAEYRERLLKWVETFQQYTGAVMAKSVEDTTFYTYVRFVALNEVGGDPSSSGGTIEAFHEENARRLRTSPHALLATSTHDTKLAEDVRARLYALSELAGEWERWTHRWHALNARHVTMLEGQAAPDAIDEYRFYQVLLGAWPLSAEEVDDALRARLRGYFRKAVSEAKRHTSALRPNEDYFKACDRFVDAVMAADGDVGRVPSPGGGVAGGRAGLRGEGTPPTLQNPFLGVFAPCAARVARLGMINSLVQVVLKCTVPGVPDIYQGNEIWDFSLVDPDNRRPVDYAQREDLLKNLPGRSTRELWENWRDGAIKLKVTRTLLRFRGERAKLFADGSYLSVPTEGAFAGSAVAFVRERGDAAVLVVVPRLFAALGVPPLGVVWENTRVKPTRKAVRWRNLLTGAEVADEALWLRTVFEEMPVAVFESVGDPAL